MKLWMGISMFAAIAVMSMGAPVKKPKPNTLITSKKMELEFGKPQMVCVYEGNVKVVDREIDLTCDVLTVTFANKKKGSAKPAGNTKSVPTPTSKVTNPPVAPFASKPVPPMIGMGGNIDMIVAEKNVEIIKKEENGKKTRATGERAVYHAKTELVVLTGNPVLFTDNNTVKGSMIILDRRTNKMSVKDPETIVLGEKKKPKQTPSAPPKR